MNKYSTFERICDFNVFSKHMWLCVLAECRMMKSVTYGKMSGSLSRSSPRTVIQSLRSKSPVSGKERKNIIATSNMSEEFNMVLLSLNISVGVSVYLYICVFVRDDCGQQLSPDGHSWWLFVS